MEHNSLPCSLNKKEEGDGYETHFRIDQGAKGLR